jgi:D-alanine-D-alanine ligase
MKVETIAIVFGAQSYEHEISIVSAIAMKKVLKANLKFIFIDSARELYEIPSDTIKSNLFSSKEYKKYDKLYFKQKGFYKKTLFGTKDIEFDIVMNLTHGGDGEDGVLASLFHFYQIPFIGPRVEASVLSFNKYFTKLYAQQCTVETLSFEYFTKDQEVKIDHYPVIIKPVRLGSSIGISIVHTQEELEYALDVAFEFDDAIIVEPFKEGIKEYNLAGTKINNEFVFSMIEEPNKGDILDFDKKYLDFNRTDKVCEATVDESLKRDMEIAFSKLYNTFFKGALIRCDFFVLDGVVYINEINPIPGSMSNYLFKDFNGVITQLGQHLPSYNLIPIQYEYVNKIQKAKGKV